MIMQKRINTKTHVSISLLVLVENIKPSVMPFTASKTMAKQCHRSKISGRPPLTKSEPPYRSNSVPE